MHNIEPIAAPAALVAVAPTVVAPERAAAPATPTANDMMTLRATCAFFGGDRPLNPSTLYRGIKAGRYPSPVRVGPNTSRWLRAECHDARQKLIVARDARL
jgi:predicted DNA-binding transcriptional regulator AlpA